MADDSYRVTSGGGNMQHYRTPYICLFDIERPAPRSPEHEPTMINWATFSIAGSWHITVVPIVAKRLAQGCHALDWSRLRDVRCDERMEGDT
jgi:hypothetical protein